jgi:polar amino acid transport system substrate-binding protein
LPYNGATQPLTVQESSVRWIAALVLLLCIFIPSPSQAQPDSLRVATRIVKPFVFEDAGNLTGFSIDLWQEVAILLGTRTDYVMKPTVADLLSTVKSGESDLAISAISITEDRERDFDFSQPMFDAGLQILVPSQGSSGGIGRILDVVLGPEFLPVLLFVLFGTLLAGNVVWFAERRRPDGVFTGRSYFPGILDAIFWAVSALATQAEMWPKSSVARLTSAVWMFVSVVFIAVFTASVTSSLTVAQLRTDIQGPDDLAGKRVATVRGSTSAQFLSQRNIATTELDTIDDAMRALERGDEDAVVYDAPVLQYYASHEGKGKVDVVGSVFRKESYGILFPTESSLRKPVNEALLRLRENGTYERLQTKWFGGENGKASSP